jgi:Aminoglycoside adenylyltransferase, C-terminal domain
MAMERDLGPYLEELTERLHAELGGALVAAWVVGSGALGGLDPLRSDVDVQAVSTARLGRPALERLAAALSHDTLPCPVRGLEFVLYAQDDLHDPAGPAFQLNLNTGARMDQHEGFDPAAEPRFWFTLDVAIARETARPLTGPAPAAVLPALPHRLIVHSLADALQWYRGHDPAQAVLAACRAWAWASNGRWLSKGEAASWASGRLADARPIEEALHRRHDPGARGLTAADAASFVDRVQRLLTQW